MQQEPVIDTMPVEAMLAEELIPAEGLYSLHDISWVEVRQTADYSVYWPAYTDHAVKVLEVNSLQFTPGEVARYDAVVLVWKTEG